MKPQFNNGTTEYGLKKSKRFLKNIAICLAVIVVFATTYALILPAITMERTTYCGMEEHTHSEECYSEENPCQIPEHVHTEECYINPDADDETAISDDGEAVQDVSDDGTQVDEESADDGKDEENVDSIDEKQQDDIGISDKENNEEQTADENENSEEKEVPVEYTYSDNEVKVVATYLGKNPLPEGITLIVRKISEDSDNYKERLQEAQQVVEERKEKDLQISVFNLYDIHFEVDGQEFEPDGKVNVQITMPALEQQMADTTNQDDASKNDNGTETDKNEKTEQAETTTSVIHFADEKTELLESDVVEQGEQCTVDFDTKSFSDYGIMLLAAPDITVWFDGTNGTPKYYRGATNAKANISSDWGGSYVMTPKTAGNTTNYSWKLRGWYDITHNKYYGLNEKVYVKENTVFYADWEAANINAPYSSTGNLNTSSFIKTDVFDYNDLFNMYSVKLETSKIDGNEHTETWKLMESGTSKKGTESMNFVFFDTKHKGHIMCVDGRNSRNANNQVNSADGANHYDGIISTGIINQNLINMLFTNDDTMGKRWIGSDSYLYQYDENTGYYYYDSTRNAAGYNKNDRRFYLYPYRVMTSKSNNTGENYSDFLPFNYGGANSTFNDSNGSTNYWFGIKSQIDFYLPNDSGTIDGSNKYGNQSTKGTDIEFKFAGDDDVWIFVDDELVLDLGGVHDICFGEINYSKGEITIAQSGATIDRTQSNGLGVKKGDAGVTTTTKKFSEGNHTLTIYYLERGASQSNCAIYFNMAPSYTLELTKKDKDNHNKLAGAKFAIYSDKACTKDAYVSGGDKGTNVFTVGASGKLFCYGLEAGHKYYIKEIEPPEGYKVCTEKVIELDIQNDGTCNYSVEKDDGSFVRDFNKNNNTHKITFTVQNEVAEPESIDIKVVKKWFGTDGTTDISDTVKEDSISFDLYQKVKGSPSDVTPGGTSGSSSGSGTGEKATITWKVSRYGNEEVVDTTTVDAGSVVKLNFVMGPQKQWTSPNGIKPIITINGTRYGYKQSGDYNGTFTVDGNVTITGDTTVLITPSELEWMFAKEQNVKYNVDIISTPAPNSEPEPEPDPAPGDDKFIGTYEVTKAENWQKTVSGLPRLGKDEKGNKIYYEYYLVEKPVQYYTTTYSNNDGIESGTITIKNKAEERPQYVLPSTGGSGTTIYTMGGLLMMISAALLLYRKSRMDAVS